MPYINKKIAIADGKKAYEILISQGFNMRTAQRLIDRARLACNGEIVREKNAILHGDVTLIEYECKPRGLKPIFETAEFAVFDKPSGVLSHPNGRHCEYSLNDEIYSLFGREAAVAHRLDKETSGLIVVAKNKASQIKLKGLFESRAVSKSYLAMVRDKVCVSELVGRGLAMEFKALSGDEKIYTDQLECVKNGDELALKQGEKSAEKFDENSEREFLENGFGSLIHDRINSKNEIFVVNASMGLAKNYDDVKTRMQICSEAQGGKSAVTVFEVLCYDERADASLLRCYPLTGRQHQIRLHLFHVQHKILGEPLYGLERDDVVRILDGEMSEDERIKLTGASRLLLHADEISFELRGEKYKIKSNFDAKSELPKKL
ncbi:RluA family pseudouridine synthase [Campylobacter majalis]|uniref:RluA family pseudouridine synthase n=1 Tax=Campylobacter majalis TaxID=2790656 RepID=UPI003D685B56